MSPGTQQRAIRLRLDVHMHAALIDAADVTGCSPSSIIRAALAAHLTPTTTAKPSEPK